jgi:hypothetical protein
MFLIIVSAYSFLQCFIMIKRMDVYFSVSDFVQDHRDNAPFNMGKYNDTFNMFIGLAESNMDLLNNPYVKANVYEKG